MTARGAGTSAAGAPGSRRALTGRAPREAQPLVADVDEAAQLADGLGERGQRQPR